MSRTRHHTKKFRFGKTFAAWNPPGWFKKMRKRARRARAHQAIREGKEPPLKDEKKNDLWDWL